MLNKVILVGRLCADPELRRTQKGTAVATVSLAVERDYTRPGETGEVDFVPLVAWGNTAEFLARNFTKGRMAIIAGRLALRKYEDRDGKKKSIMEVVASDIYFGDSKPKNGAESSSPHVPAPNATLEPAGFAEMTDEDPDLPF